MDNDYPYANCVTLAEHPPMCSHSAPLTGDSIRKAVETLRSKSNMPDGSHFVISPELVWADIEAFLEELNHPQNFFKDSYLTP